MWVPTSHWGMGALTLYCMHFGVSSRRCIRRAVTTPYWGMESLTSHGKVLGSLLSTLCAESVNVGVLSTLCTESVSVGVVVRREVSSRRLAGLYIAAMKTFSVQNVPLLTSSVLVSTLCPRFHPLVLWISPS
jgi:hypothetical protein